MRGQAEDLLVWGLLVGAGMNRIALLLLVASGTLASEALADGKLQMVAVGSNRVVRDPLKHLGLQPVAWQDLNRLPFEFAYKAGTGIWKLTGEVKDLAMATRRTSQHPWQERPSPFISPGAIEWSERTGNYLSNWPEHPEVLPSYFHGSSGRIWRLAKATDPVASAGVTESGLHLIDRTNRAIRLPTPAPVRKFPTSLSLSDLRLRSFAIGGETFIAAHFEAATLWRLRPSGQPELAGAIDPGLDGTRGTGGKVDRSGMAGDGGSGFWRVKTLQPALSPDRAIHLVAISTDGEYRSGQWKVYRLTIEPEQPSLF